MALGKTGIQNARTTLEEMRKYLDQAETSNSQFKELFENANFQKFVMETNKGATLNEQLNSLNQWINELCETVRDLDDLTTNYLNTQELENE